MPSRSRLVHAIGIAPALALAFLSACTNPGPDTSSSSSSTSSSGGAGSSSSSSGNASSSSSSSTGGSSGSSTSSGGASSGLIIRTPDPTVVNNADRDSDCDGLTDEYEYGATYAGGAKTDPANPDSDGDGVLDGVEAGSTSITAGDAAACGTFTGDSDPSTRTNPAAADTDADGIPDGAEDHNGNGRVDDGETDPLDTDSDGDGIPDGVEDANHDGIVQSTETSAALRDTDGDGIPDGIEDANHDGIRQPNETDPRNADSDGDGLSDGDEDPNWNHVVDQGESDPLSPDTDTDQDGIPDARELTLGYDINDPDMDDDGLKDGEEDRNKNGVIEANETNPRLPDTDCDGLKDGEEDLDKDGVLDDNETDPRARDSDGDLLSDGLERGITVNPDPTNCTSFIADTHPATGTNPRVADTDSDGINDGVEDRNKDGQRQPTETDPNTADTDGDGLKDGEEDLNDNGVVDIGETDPLVPDTDTDGDGLTDAAEARLGTNPNLRDSDSDGLEDGQEDKNRDGTFSIGETNPVSADTDCDGLSDGEEDANKNGIVDPGETDPLNNDSDYDGLLDGIERGRTQNLDPTRCTAFVGAATPSNATDPLIADSDGDGVPDGTEDANQNGRVDDGELNPNNNADAGGIIQTVCSVNALTPIVFHNTPTPMPDIQLATIATFGARQELSLAGQVVGQVVVDQTASAPMVAFSFSRAPAADELTANDIAVKTLQALTGVPGGLANPITQALPCANPPADCTWDRFPAVLGSYDYGTALDAFVAVNSILDRLLPGVTGTLTGSLGRNGPFKLRMEFVRRSNNRVVIIGVVMPTSTYNTTTSYNLDDAANGTSLAQVGDQTGVQCDLFETQPYPQADILLVIDNSGSMGDNQQALALAADAVLNQLQNALIDWRIARITTDADDPHYSDCRMPRVYGDPAAPVDFCTCPGSTCPCECQTTSSDPRAHIWPFIKPASNSQTDFDIAAAIVRDKLMKPGINGWSFEAAFEPLKYALAGATGTLAQYNYLPAVSGPAQAWKVRAGARFAVLFVSDAGEQSNATQRTHYNWGSDGLIGMPPFDVGPVLKFLRGGPNNGVALPGTLEIETWDPYRATEPAMFAGGIICPLGQVCDDSESSTTGSDPRLRRYHEVINGLGGIVGSIQDTTSVGPTVQAFMTAVIGSASPYVLSKAPISASIKVAIDEQPVTGCNWGNIPRSRVNGFDYDSATKQITFYGTCRPSNETAFLNKRMAVSYRYWIDKTPNPDGTPNPCDGACVAPLVCNPATNQCECPADCGISGGCASPRVCDTNPAVCACTCPPDCGGSPSNPRLICDTQDCQFECPSDCGGPSPGPDFQCNPTTCQYECAACDPATRPTTNPERFTCDLTTCRWTCPEDCATTSPGGGFRCDRTTCSYTCAPDCGGICSGNETCNTTTCGCLCVQNVTCGAGLVFDPVACECACDTAALDCSPRHEADPTTCSCACKPDCGGTCPGGEFCAQSLCECQSIGG